MLPGSALSSQMGSLHPLCWSHCHHVTFRNLTFARDKAAPNRRDLRALGAPLVLEAHRVEGRRSQQTLHGGKLVRYILLIDVWFCNSLLYMLGFGIAMKMLLDNLVYISLWSICCMRIIGTKKFVFLLFDLQYNFSMQLREMKSQEESFCLFFSLSFLFSLDYSLTSVSLHKIQLHSSSTN